MNVPGNVGYSIFGDESIELWRDPIAYINRRKTEHGPLFVGRVLNKPTIFVTSNSTVKEFLCDNNDNFTSGYHEYMYELFEKNVMFLEGDLWKEGRALLHETFVHDNLHQTIDIAKQLIKDHIKNMPTEQPLQVYQNLKVLTTRLSISLFLSHTLNETEYQEVSQLMTTHWHGIISLPVSMKIPLLPFKSGYGKALSAKDKLIEIISDKIQNDQSSPIASSVHDAVPVHDSTLSHDSTMSHDLAVRNILLFISALFPKGMASLMTSVLLNLSKPENSHYLSQCLNDDDNMIEYVILECQRLWPPFLGGRRVCSKSCLIGGYQIPKDHAVVYTAYTANRDETIFTEPDLFKPERWVDGSLNKDLLWTFGGGPRTCVGQHLSTLVLKEWLKLSLSSLSWQLCSGIDTPYKILPVIRPSDDVSIVFHRLDPKPETDSNTQ